jgi:hypothetical protein
MMNDELNLRVLTDHSFEMNFYPSIFQLKVVESDDKSIAITLLNNEVSQILTEGMRCTIEFPDNLRRAIRINAISENNGVRRLECRYLHPGPLNPAESPARKEA